MASPRNWLPHINLTVGVIALALSLLAKQNLPPAVGSAPALQLPCAFFSSVFLPLGTWLALRALIVEPSGTRRHLTEFLTGIVIGFVVLAWIFFASFFGGYVTEQVLNFQADANARLLPKLISNASTATYKDAAKREEIAAFAYKIYGVTIAYVGPDDQLIIFVPSNDEKQKRLLYAKQDQEIATQFATVRQLYKQLAYLFGLYAGTYVTAFLVGGSILIYRMRGKDSRDSALTSS